MTAPLLPSTPAALDVPSNQRRTVATQSDDPPTVPASVIRYREINAALNADIERALATGAPAILLLGDHVLLDEQALELLVQVGSQAGGCIVSGTVALSSHPQVLLGQGHWWSQDETCWHEHRCIGLRRSPATESLTGTDSMAVEAAFIPATAWRRVGAFDTRFTRCLADLDWALRARSLGITMLRAEGVRFMASTPADTDVDRFERLSSSFRLARKHGLPAPAWRLGWQRIALDAERECSLVRYMTNESQHVGRFKRMAWYLANLAGALRRDRFRKSVAQTWRAMHDEAPDARGAP